MAMLSKPRKPSLTLSIDYGTRTASVSFTISDDKQREVQPILFNQRPQIPQQAAWDANGNFLFGHEVTRAVNARRIQPGEVITQWKLCLYPDFTDTNIAKHVEVQLRRYGKSLDQLLAEHIRALVDSSKSVLKGGKTGHGYSDEEINAMPTKLLLSVPKMWEVPESHKMATAAKAAGVDHVDILYEPQCAAAYLLDDIIKRPTLTASMRVGSVILVADPGGGTGDFVAYEIVAGAGHLKFDLQQIGTARGSLCGSEFVGFHFVTHLTNKACEHDGLRKTFKQRCEDLGRTEQDIYKIAMDAFEPHKKDFAEDAVAPMLIVIGGGPGKESSSWTIQVTCDEMRSFFQPVINEIMRQIDDGLDELQKMRRKVTHIAVVGGMRGSSFFMRQISSKYGTAHKIIGDGDEMLISTHAVAHGAHLRYNDIRTNDLESVGYFGVERDEEFDETIHTDVFTVSPRTGAKIFSDRLSFESDGQRFVRRRWQQVNIENGAIDLLYLARPREVQDQMKLQIWWTRDKVANGAPFLTEDGMLDRETFVRFGSPMVKQCLNWEAEGFELRYTEKIDPVQPWPTEQEIDEEVDAINDPASDSDYLDNDGLMEIDYRRSKKVRDIHKPPAKTQGPRPDRIFAPTPNEEASIRDDTELDPMEVFIEGVDEKIFMEDGRSGKLIAAYEVYTRLTVTSDGANTSTKWVVVKPGTQPFDEMGKPKKDKKQAMQVLGEEDVVELIDAAFSPYARG